MFIKQLLVFFHSYSKITLSIFACVILAHSTEAGTIDIDDAVFYAKAVGPSHSFEQIKSDPSVIPFIKGESAVLHTGFSENAYWIKIDPNPALLKGQHTWLLELATCKLNRIDLFYKNINGEWIREKAGSHVNTQDQRINGRNFVFLLSAWNKKSPLLMKVQTIYLRVPIHIWHTQDFFKKEQNQVLTDGIFFGIVFAIICYHLFIFVALRIKSYLHYAIFLVAVLLWYLSGEGWMFAYLFCHLSPPFSDLTHLSSPFLGWVLLISGIQFTRSYLRLWIHSWKLDRIMRYSQWLLAAVGFLGLGLIIAEFYSYFAALYNFGFILIILSIALCFYSAFKAFLHKQVTARYYLLATMLQFTVAIFMILAVFDFLPIGYNWKILQISSVIEMLIFSFGLSRQVKQIKMEREDIKRELEIIRQDMLEQRKTIDQLQDQVLSRMMESRLYPEFAKLFPILASITYIQAIGNFSKVIFLENGMENEIELQAGLKDIERCFGPDYFTRIHKTYLVRAGIPYTMQRRSTADYDMVSRHFVLPVGRKHAKNLKESATNPI